MCCGRRGVCLVWRGLGNGEGGQGFQGLSSLLFKFKQNRSSFPTSKLDINPCLPFFQSLHEVSLGSTTSSACLQVVQEMWFFSLTVVP